MNTIVTLIDFPDVTPRLVEQTERYAKALGSRVILIHIVAKSSQSAGNDAILADYRKLTEIGKCLSKAGLNVLVEQLVDADVCRAMDECRTWDAELIIVGSHHHSVLYNWFVGSFT